MTESRSAQTTLPAQPTPLPASYYEHGGRILEVAGKDVKVLAELSHLTVIPRSARHLDLPPRLRRSARGPVLDHPRLDLSDLTVSVQRTTWVSLSMIAQAACGSRPVPGLSYEQGCALTREYLISSGNRDVAESRDIQELPFTHGQLAALLRAPWLIHYPVWVRTYDVASGALTLLPGDEAHADHLTQVLALRAVLSGEALEEAVTRLRQMHLREVLPVRAETTLNLSTPLRLLLAARGEDEVLELLYRSDALSHAAEDAVGLIRNDLEAGGGAHDRLQVAARSLVRNPSGRPVLISSDVADLYLSGGSARLLTPGSPESLAAMGRGEPRLVSDGSGFRNAPALVHLRDVDVQQGRLTLRSCRVRLQDGAVHHDDVRLTLERQASGAHTLTTLNLMKPGREARVRTVAAGGDVLKRLGYPFTELTPTDRAVFLYDPLDDLPF